MGDLLLFCNYLSHFNSKPSINGSGLLLVVLVFIILSVIKFGFGVLVRNLYFTILSSEFDMNPLLMTSTSLSTICFKCFQFFNLVYLYGFNFAMISSQFNAKP